MRKYFVLFSSLVLIYINVQGQNDESYLRANAILVDNPEKLNDSIYSLLAPFQVIMFGEMHGTNESAPFVKGLANLFTSKGDSVSVGLEIPPMLMTTFLSRSTDSSIYASDFFSQPAVSGKESVPWAALISALNKNKKVQLFFFDVNASEG